MILNEIKNMATKMNVDTDRISQNEIILAIQKAEGNIPCFGTDRKYHCPETNCLWEEDCKNTL